MMMKMTTTPGTTSIHLGSIRILTALRTSHVVFETVAAGTMAAIPTVRLVVTGICHVTTVIININNNVMRFIIMTYRGTIWNRVWMTVVMVVVVMVVLDWCTAGTRM